MADGGWRMADGGWKVPRWFFFLLPFHFVLFQLADPPTVDPTSPRKDCLTPQFKTFYLAF